MTHCATSVLCVLEVLSNVVDDLDDEALHDAVVAVQREIDVLTARQAQLLARWDARNIWSQDGSLSCGHRYARETGLSVKEAKRLVHRARKLSSMPVVASAFTSGELSVSRVDLLVRTNQPHLTEVFSRDESLLVSTVKSLSFNDACRALKYWQCRADPDGAEDKAKKLVDGRHAQVARTFDDTVDLQAVFEPLGGEIVLRELQRLEDELFVQDWAKAKALYDEEVSVDKLWRTPAQRRCDALVVMATRSVSASGGSPKPLLNILVGEDRFKDICELASGTVLPPGQVLPLLTDAQIESIIFDGSSKILDIKHQRSFTGAVRTALNVRDRHCQHPSGCDVPASRCEGDHIIAWSRGGFTDQTNGQLLCAKHNRVKGTGPP